MSAFMVREEEEVTPWEGPAMVHSKALESGREVGRLVVVRGCGMMWGVGQRWYLGFWHRERLC